MKTTINVRGFDDDANRILSSAFNLHKLHYTGNLNTLHLGYTTLLEEDIFKVFCETCKVDGQAILDKLIKEIESMAYENNTDNIAFDPNIMTQGMLKIFNNLGSVILSTGITVGKNEIYAMLISVSNTEFLNFLEDNGVDTDNLVSGIKGMIDTNYYPESTIDMVESAKAGAYDSVFGRDEIIDRMIEILGRRRKGNPCIIGEPGVGKSSIVEGLAQRIANGDVPDYLKKATILNIDFSAIMAGCRYRGDFEEKFGNLISQLENDENNILFFDEFHTLAGSNNDSGGGIINALNMLKPALASGTIRIIGATTSIEYEKYIAKDKAFDRRIQTVLVEEPTIEESIKMISNTIEVYSEYHNVKISDEIIECAVKLSDRYIKNERLPDKAITLLDETSSRIKVNSRGKKVKLKTSDIKETIARITGIDSKDVGSSDRDKYMNLDKSIKKSVIGQEEAVKEVSMAIKRNKAGIRKNDRPIGSFMFIGPTGVGKTELAKVLAKELFGSTKAMIRFDMSEFMEKHSVSKLIGAPPGYIGHDDGGILTSAVRRTPYSIVLLDEIEKAHSDVFNIFLQIMDDGVLTDSKGNKVDFKNTIIIMTSNVGHSSKEDTRKSIGFMDISNNTDNTKDIPNETMKALENTFRPEFLNRLDKVIKFNSLGEKEVEKITKLMLNEIVESLKEDNITIEFEKSVISLIAKEGFSTKFGARNIRREIQDRVENYLADLILSGEIKANDRVVMSSLRGNIKHKIKTTKSEEMKLYEECSI